MWLLAGGVVVCAPCAYTQTAEGDIRRDATVLAVEGGVGDEHILLAAVLHDTVEDTQTTFAELAEHFGDVVAALVREVTDDKTLPKQERKRLQVEHAPHVSHGAKQLKIADKICNVRDIAASPPADWPAQRRQEYLAWACRVVEGCRGVNEQLDVVFDAALARAREVLAVAAKR